LLAQEEEAASPMPAVVKPSAVTVKPVTVEPQVAQPEAVKAVATVSPQSPSSVSFNSDPPIWRARALFRFNDD